MKLKSITQANLTNKTVLVRVDYNVPLRKIDGVIAVTDDVRLTASLPTITYLQKNQCKIVLISHLGRPDGVIKKHLSLKPVAKKLSQLLNSPVGFVNQLVGEKSINAVDGLQPGDVLLLENTRFDPGEIVNDPKLSQNLAELADVFINDAFSSSHRAHASVLGVTKHLPSYAGIALQKEIDMLAQLVEKPKRPLVVIVGGAKISNKVDAVCNLSHLADTVLVGGGVANNFLKADGVDTCASYMQDTVVDANKQTINFVDVAGSLLAATKQEKLLLHGYIPLPKIIYPIDVVAATSRDRARKIQIINLATSNNHTPKQNLMFLDIGPNTQKLYREIILAAETIFWNGPMGAFENEAFCEGTRAVATAVAKVRATTIIGGGDTISAVKQFHLENRYDYISAAGGAALDYLAGNELPGIKPLML